MAGKVRPKTITGYRTDAKWVAKTIGDVRLCDLTPEHIESMYGAMRRANRSAGTVLHVRRTVRAALQTAVDRGRIIRNPVALAEAPGDDAPEVEPLDAPEVQAVLSAAAAAKSGARWVLALVTGMRQGEVLGLQWDDISWESGEIRVRSGGGRGATAAPTRTSAPPPDPTSAHAESEVVWSPANSRRRLPAASWSCPRR